VNENGKTIGSVDIWRSLLTKEMFCEEKRLGILDIVDYIGMPRIEKEKKWAVAVSRKRSGHMRWKLVKLVQNGKFAFSDADDKRIEVEVKDFSITDPEWWSFLVENYVNRNVEVAVEQK
jgi:hypothetical protein